VAPRVSPTETIRAEIHAAFDGEGDLLSAIEQVARLSVRLTFQSVVEEIIVEELCRERYERRGEDSPMGLRNGFQPPRTIKTCGCREPRPPSSGDHPVFVNEAAQTIGSS